eukprot:COSAG06_NODE_60126_length_272_cov_0.554913_1_plen_61_part_01
MVRARSGERRVGREGWACGLVLGGGGGWGVGGGGRGGGKGVAWTAVGSRVSHLGQCPMQLP